MPRCVSVEEALPMTKPTYVDANLLIAAMDSIHVATALPAGADEFISVEKPTRPMFRVRDIHMISLRGKAP